VRMARPLRGVLSPPIQKLAFDVLGICDFVSLDQAIDERARPLLLRAVDIVPAHRDSTQRRIANIPAAFGPLMEALMHKDTPAAASPPKARCRYRSLHWEVPIVDGNLRIVGWTKASPEFLGTSLRHPEAERLISEKVACVYVQIVDRDAARRAGAPDGWAAPWRCLAIVAESGASGRDEGTPLLDVTA
jgi:hypothetical protein